MYSESKGFCPHSPSWISRSPPLPHKNHHGGARELVILFQSPFVRLIDLLVYDEVHKGHKLVNLLHYGRFIFLVVRPLFHRATRWTEHLWFCIDNLEMIPRAFHYWWSLEDVCCHYFHLRLIEILQVSKELPNQGFHVLEC